MARIDELSISTSRCRNTLIKEALANYLDLQMWQVAEIRKGIAEADRGDFASDSEVRRILNRYTKRRS
ncbi:MAG TPA: CopG family transcriptional regulator [Terriglobales bacterium]